jgi:hypothetical protein
VGEGGKRLCGIKGRQRRHRINGILIAVLVRCILATITTSTSTSTSPTATAPVIIVIIIVTRAAV